MTLPTGARLGPYEIVAPLGAGGMGEVYRARDTRLGREVAVKVLPEGFSHDPDRLARFEREARSASALSDPHIVVVYDVGEEDGTRYIATELVDGSDLRTLLRKGALPPRTALDLGSQIAQGLAAAHDKGILHRDLKPENILVTADGIAKIADFGLAKLAEPPVEWAGEMGEAPTLDAARTASGVVLGTVSYMSPEQVKGGELDQRSDQFALGAILHEMATGKNPFLRTTAAETMTAILREEPESLTAAAPQLPGPARWLIERLLSKEPRERYVSTRDLARELASIRNHLSESIGSMGSGAQLAAPDKRQRGKRALTVVVALIAVAAAALGLTGGLLWRHGSKSPSQALRLNVDLPPGVEPETGNAYFHAPRLALSPDGLSIAIVGISGGRSRLYLRRLDEAAVRPLPGTDGGRAPFFSPDGRWVGFWADGRLLKVRISGGEPSVLCDAPAGEVGAAWGPDNTILFGTEGGLFSVAATGGVARQITTPDASHNEYLHTNPVLLPGGREALFEADLIGNAPAQLDVLDLGKGTWRKLLDGATAPKYLPSGWLMVEVAGRLEKAPFDAKTASLAGPLEPIALSGAAQEPTSRSLSYDIAGPHGTLVYSVESHAATALYWIRRDGSKELVSREHRAGWHPTLSPDGRRLAINDQINAEISEIWVLDIARDAWQRLTSGKDDWEPIWLGDGKDLAYAEARGGNAKSWDLFEIPADGSGSPRRMATYAHQVGSLALAPDGQEVLWDDMRGGIWLQRFGGKRAPRPFLSSGGAVSRSFSPDGRWIAYSTASGGEPQVYVTEFPAARHRYLISQGGGADPIWSLSGNAVYYQKGRSIFVVRVHPGEPFSAAQPRLFVKADVDFASYDVSAGGSRIVIQSSGAKESERTSIVCIPSALPLLTGKR